VKISTNECPSHQIQLLVHGAAYLVNNVELLFGFVKLERLVRTDEIDLVVKVHFNDVTVPTRFESEITAQRYQDSLYTERDSINSTPTSRV